MRLSAHDNDSPISIIKSASSLKALLEDISRCMWVMSLESRYANRRFNVTQMELG